MVLEFRGRFNHDNLRGGRSGRGRYVLVCTLVVLVSLIILAEYNLVARLRRRPVQSEDLSVWSSSVSDPRRGGVEGKRRNERGLLSSLYH